MYPVELDKSLKRKKRFRRMLTIVTFMLALSAMLAVSAFADEAVPVTALAAGGSMTDLVEQLFSSFTIVVKGLASGLKEAFANLIYVDPSADSPVFSPLVIFIFVMAGLGVATAIFYKIFGVIQARRG